MDILYDFIPRYLSKVYCTDSTKRGTKRVFSFQQKLSYLFSQDIRAVTLISFSAKIKILLRFCYIYAHANFQGEEAFM